MTEPLILIKPVTCSRALAGTRLTLRHTVQAEDQLPKVAAGWHICLDVADRLLAGNPVPVIRGAEAKKYGWQDLADAYAARLDLKEDA